MSTLHTFDAAQRFWGLEVGCRMTVIAIEGSLLLHSPIDLDPARLAPLGTPRWLLAPNRLHHLYAGPWLERGLESWAAPGLPERRPDLNFDHVVERRCEPFGDDVLLLPLRCFAMTMEVVLLHRPTRTLVVTDLVFNITRDAPWATRAALWCSGAYPGCRTSILERLGIKRAIAREELGELLELDFDRLIPSHGAIIETGGKDALRQAYRWLRLCSGCRLAIVAIVTVDNPARDIFSYRRYWAERFGVAPELPTTREEMDALGWDSCDVVIVTGDAYVDHPSFGMAIVGRLLEAQGFRVGIIAQPDWRSAEDIARLGRPNIFFGVTGGNMDSMVNRYTADRRVRSDDAYTPDGAPDRRPDRAVLVYAQRCREAFGDVPIILGGIEASLRRVAHFDVWSEKVRRSVLVDAKADLLVYGNAERAIVEIAHRLAGREAASELTDIRGTAFLRREVPEGFTTLDATSAADREPPACRPGERDRTVVRLPAYEAVAKDRLLYAHASRIVHRRPTPATPARWCSATATASCGSTRRRSR
jgi:hypothetical protein